MPIWYGTGYNSNTSDGTQQPTSQTQFETPEHGVDGSKLPASQS